MPDAKRLKDIYISGFLITFAIENVVSVYVFYIKIRLYFNADSRLWRDKMLLPPDWDKPSPANEKLCEKFNYGQYETNGFCLPYRLFVPETQEKFVPLVLHLHGADAVGNDNESQLSTHDIGTMFVRDEWQQEHPCFVLAPQYGHG